VESLKYFNFTSYHLQTENLNSSFLLCIPFISFSCLIALVRNSRTILNESGHLCLVPDFIGNDFSFSSFSRMLAICLYISLYYIEVYSPLFVVSLWLYIEKLLYFVKGFFLHLLSWSHGFCPFVCFLQYFSYDLHMLNHPCIPK
jgi:hypothetical protein